MFWKKERNIVVAAEIGSCKVAVAVSELREDGSLFLMAVGEAPSGKVRKCEITDFQTSQDCLKDALRDAEEKTDVAIQELYLALSGAHIRSVNTRVSTLIENEGDEIRDFDIEVLRQKAQDYAAPAEAVLLHDLLRHYYLDDGSTVPNPVGISSKKVFADYHLVYGMATRLQTTLRCVKDLSIDVPGYALSSYATAQSVLTHAQKQAGSIVINCGGGVTDYIAYERGAVVHTGVLGVGGEHLTSDLSIGLKISFAKAEELKRKEGSVYFDSSLENEIAIRDLNFSDRHIYRESMVTILGARQEEMFKIILEELSEQAFWAEFSGTIYFTGGASQMRGLLDLAREIFPHPVEMAKQKPMEGDQSYLNRPDLATVFGLLQYARSDQMYNPPVRGWNRMQQSFRKVLSVLKLL